MMADREKVIKGLNDIHAVACGLGDDECYLNSIGIKQLQTLINDATELLKAQEPRVMTLEEVNTAAGRDVWLELSGNIAEDVMIATTIEGCGPKGICTRYESLNYVGYGIKPYGWRCWTSRPTDEQREAIPWES